MRIYLQACLALTLLSCENTPQESFPVDNEPQTYLMSKDSISPANTDNPYDIAGQLHNDVLESYLPLESDTSSVATIISQLEEIALQDARFVNIMQPGYSTPAASRVQEILSDPLLSTTSILAGSGLGAAAKSSLSDFLSDVMLLRDEEAEYNDIYDYIIAYEAGVVASTVFTTTEQRMLLVNSSIARHSFYFNERRKRKKLRDREWDTLITTLTAGIEGMGSGTASSIMMSAATAAAANQ